MKDIKNNEKFYKICFWLLSFGIIINKFVIFPWEGMVATVDGISIETSRAWLTVGIRRITGFSRTAFNAATYILILGIITSNKYKGKMKIAVWIYIIYLTILTTTKGTIISAIAILGYMIFKEKEVIAKYVCIGMICIMIFIPIISLQSRPIFVYLRENLTTVVYAKYISSFEDRCLNVWPSVINFIKDNRKLNLGERNRRNRIFSRIL